MIPSRLDQVLSQKTGSDVPKAMMGPRFGSGQPGSEGSLSSAAAGVPEEPLEGLGALVPAAAPAPCPPPGLRGRKPPPLAAHSPAGRASCSLSGPLPAHLLPAQLPLPCTCGPSRPSQARRSWGPGPSPARVRAALALPAGTGRAPHTGTGPRGPQVLSDEPCLPPGSQGGRPSWSEEGSKQRQQQERRKKKHFRNMSVWNVVKALSEQ